MSPFPIVIESEQEMDEFVRIYARQFRVKCENVGIPLLPQVAEVGGEALANTFREWIAKVEESVGHA